MASNYMPQIHVNCLDSDELKYELSIRNAFNTRETYDRRRATLKSLLDAEDQSPTALKYKANYTAEIPLMRYKDHMTD